MLRKITAKSLKSIIADAKIALCLLNLYKISTTAGPHSLIFVMDKLVVSYVHGMAARYYN